MTFKSHLQTLMALFPKSKVLKGLVSRSGGPPYTYKSHIRICSPLAKSMFKLIILYTFFFFTGASDIPDTMTMDTFFSPNSINNPYSFRRGHRELIEAPIIRRPRKVLQSRGKRVSPNYNNQRAPSPGNAYGSPQIAEYPPGVPQQSAIPFLGNTVDPRSMLAYGSPNGGYASPEYLPGATGATGTAPQYGGGSASGGQYASGGAGYPENPATNTQYSGGNSSPSHYPPGDGKQAYSPYSNTGQGYSSEGQGGYSPPPSSDGSYSSDGSSGGDQGYGYGDSGPGYSGQGQGHGGDYSSGAREYSDGYGGQGDSYGGQGGSYGGQGDSYSQDQGYDQEQDYSQGQSSSDGKGYSQDGGYSQGQSYPDGRGYPSKGGNYPAKEEEDFEIDVKYAHADGSGRQANVIESPSGNSEYQEWGASAPGYNTEYDTEMGLNPLSDKDYLNDQPLNDAPLGSPHYGFEKHQPRVSIPAYIEERVHLIPPRQSYSYGDKLKETVEPYKYFGRQKLTQTYSRIGPTPYRRERVERKMLKREGTPLSPNGKLGQNRMFVGREEVFEETNHPQRPTKSANRPLRPAHFYTPPSESGRKLRPLSFEPRPPRKTSHNWEEYVHPYSSSGKRGSTNPYFNTKPHDTTYFSYQIHQFTRPEPYLETDHHPQSRPFEEHHYHSKPEGRNIHQYHEDNHDLFSTLAFRKEPPKIVANHRPHYLEYPEGKDLTGLGEKYVNYNPKSSSFHNQGGDRGYSLRHMDKSRAHRDWSGRDERSQFFEGGSNHGYTEHHNDDHRNMKPGGFGYQGETRQVIHGTMDDFSHSMLPLRPHLQAPLPQPGLFYGQGRTIETNQPVSPQPQYKPALPIVGVPTPRQKEDRPQLAGRSKRLMFGVPMSLKKRARPQRYMTLVDAYRQGYPLRILPYDYQRRRYKMSHDSKMGNSHMTGNNLNNHMVSNFRSIINSELPGL